MYDKLQEHAEMSAGMTLEAEALPSWETQSGSGALASGESSS